MSLFLFFSTKTSLSFSLSFKPSGTPRSGTPSRREPEPRRLRVAASPLAGAARAAAAVRSGPPAGGRRCRCRLLRPMIESPSTSKAQLELEAVRVSALCIVRVRVIARMLFESCQCIPAPEYSTRDLLIRFSSLSTSNSSQRPPSIRILKFNPSARLAGRGPRQAEGERP